MNGNFLKDVATNLRSKSPNQIMIMKKILFSGFLLFAGFATIAQTADEIISKHITAIGGADNWKKVNSVIMEGTMNVMGNDVSVKVTQENGKGSRQDISVAGMTGFVIITPTEGWTYMPFQGQQAPEPMTADDIKEGMDDLDIQGNLIDYKAKGHTVEYLGTEDVQGTECYKLKVIRKNSGEQTLFIDKDSHLIVKTSQKRKAMGQEMDISVEFSDYKEVNGLKFPHALTQAFGTIVMSSVKVNETIPAETFSKPK